MSLINNRPALVDSSWPSHVIWWHKSGSTLALIMACCLMVPSHYMNQCWFLISEVLWHSPGSSFTISSSNSIPNRIQTMKTIGNHRHWLFCWWSSEKPEAHRAGNQSAQATILYKVFKNYTFSVSATSARDQWVKIMDKVEFSSYVELITQYQRNNFGNNSQDYIVHSSFSAFEHMEG